jgi:hypothetical protein
MNSKNLNPSGHWLTLALGMSLAHGSNPSQTRGKKERKQIYNIKVFYLNNYLYLALSSWPILPTLVLLRKDRFCLVKIRLLKQFWYRYGINTAYQRESKSSLLQLLNRRYCDQRTVTMLMSIAGDFGACSFQTAPFNTTNRLMVYHCRARCDFGAVISLHLLISRA